MVFFIAKGVTLSGCTLLQFYYTLYISQPTLTNYINKIEEGFGIKLFDRSVTPIQVTAAGALYIDKMKKVQREVDLLEKELRNMAQHTVITIGISGTRGDHWLPEIIPDFIKMNPDVSIQLFERGDSKLEQGLLHGHVDVAIGALNTNFTDMIYETIIEEPILLAIPREFECVSNLEKSQGTVRNPHYITGHKIKNIPFLIPHSHSDFYRVSQMMLKEADVNPGRVVSYKNINTAYQLAASGVGALFITSGLFDYRFPQCTEKLVFCSLQKDIYVRNCVVGYRKDSEKINLINDLIKLTREKIIPIINNTN